MYVLSWEISTGFIFLVYLWDVYAKLGRGLSSVSIQEIVSVMERIPRGPEPPSWVAGILFIVLFTEVGLVVYFVGRFWARYVTMILQIRKRVRLRFTYPSERN